MIMDGSLPDLLPMEKIQRPATIVQWVPIPKAGVLCPTPIPMNHGKPVVFLLEFWQVLKDAFFKWNEKDPFKESAVIAYYAIFSLPGLLVVIFTITSYFFSQEVVSGALHREITKALGAATADQIGEIMTRASGDPKSIWATIIGIVTILVGATGVFVQLQKALNIIWEVKAEAGKSGIWAYLRARVFSFGLIVSIAFLLLISLVVTSLITAMSAWIEAHWPSFMLFLFQAFNLIFSLGLITLLFALMFKVLPDARISWRRVWLGGLITSLLFAIGKYALGIYFGTADPGSGYGAAGSIILILLWVSYSSMIVFYGAEFTKLYSERFHGKVAPSSIAKKEKGRVR